MKSTIHLILALVVYASISSMSAQAQILVAFNPTGTNTETSLAPSSVDASVTSTNLARSSATAGYDAAGGSNNFFGVYQTTAGFTPGQDYSQFTLTEAVSDGYYFGFTITAGSSPVSITGLNMGNDFFHQFASTDYFVESSLSGFGTNAANILGEALAVPGATTNYIAGPGTITFSAPMTLAAGASDEFRIYFSNNPTFTDAGIGDGGSATPNATPFEVLGSAAVPEPSTFAFLGLGLAALTITVRKRNRICK